MAPKHMDQDPISQNQNQNQGFWAKNRNYLIAVGVVAAIAIVYFATRGNVPKEQQQMEEGLTNEQVSGENTNPNGQEGNNQNQTPSASTVAETAGDVSATGKLRLSDDASKGNFLLESQGRRIYVSTRRDFSALLEKEVTLDAKGDISSFVFLGFKEATVAPVTPAEASADAGTVSFSGKLRLSDDETRGNYLIISDSTKVYLKSVHDYAAWIGSEVNLAANGTMQSFTGARLNKK